MHCQFVSQKLVILFLVPVCSLFASSGVCANVNLIVITLKEQTGAESIVYSAERVTRSSSFTKWLNRRTVVKGIQIVSPLFICILKA